MNMSSVLSETRRLLPGGQDLRRLREFFRYHGLYAPGVRLLRRLPIGLKVAVVSSCFVVPLMLMGGLYARSSWQVLDQTRSERQGIVQVEQVMVLAQAVRAEVRAVQLGLMGRPVGTIGDLERLVDGAFRNAGNLLGQDGHPAGDFPGWDSVRARHDAARAAANGVTPARLEALEAYSRSLEQLVRRIGEHSELEFDNDPPVHFAQQALVEGLPRLLDGLGQARTGALMAMASPAGASWRPHVIQRHASATDAMAASVSQLRQFHARPEIKGSAWLAKETWAPISGFLDGVVNAVLADHPTEGPDAVLAEGDAAVERAARLHAEVAVGLRTLLEVREKSLQDRLVTLSVLGVTMVLLGLYLLFAFYKVMDGGLALVRQQVTRMAEGDLSSRPVPRGSDEVAMALAALGNSLARLADLFSAVRQGVSAMSHASHAMSGGTANLATRTQQAAESMAEIMAGVGRYVEQLEDSGRRVDEAMNVVQTLRLEALRSHQHMQRLNERMHVLRGKSREIGEIVEVIDHIAFRTNILALNAAVEAAKAGPAGRGFAVVAQEVRSLAMRTAESARRVAGIVTGSTDDIEQGSELADLIVRALGETDTNVSKIHQSMDQIVGLTRSGLANSQEILAQIRQVDGMSAENHGLVAQMAAATDDLSRQGDRLNDKVLGFKLV